jgi:hypothetical protein
MKKVLIMALMTLSAAVVNGQSKETRDVKGFTKVNFGISGDLFIDFGSDFNVVLEGNSSDFKDIETEVSNGRLLIKKDNFRFDINHKVTVRITMPQLEGLSVSGSGKAEVTQAVKDADRLDLDVSGSGKILTSGIVADRLNCGISGSGNIEIGGQGNADSGEINISGSGSYNGEQCEIDHLQVSISGSGNCTCKAGDSLTASVSGSGNVHYSGSPKLDVRVSGSGKVRSM